MSPTESKDDRGAVAAALPPGDLTSTLMSSYFEKFIPAAPCRPKSSAAPGGGAACFDGSRWHWWVVEWNVKGGPSAGRAGQTGVPGGNTCPPPRLEAKAEFRYCQE